MGTNLQPVYQVSRLRPFTPGEKPPTHSESRPNTQSFAQMLAEKIKQRDGVQNATTKK